jgi:hypothetical protein
MNMTTQTMEHHPTRATAFKWVASSSVMAAIVAIAVIALSIVGLARVYPPTMAAIATIIVGAAILIEGGVFEAARTGDSGAMFSAHTLGAIAGIVLGILALMGVASFTLLSVAVLVFGVTLFLSGSSMPERGFAVGPMDGQLLLGLSVLVMGLLAVIGVNSLTLVLVGLLLLGVAGLFGGSMRSFKALHNSGS